MHDEQEQRGPFPAQEPDGAGVRNSKNAHRGLSGGVQPAGGTAGDGAAAAVPRKKGRGHSGGAGRA